MQRPARYSGRLLSKLGRGLSDFCALFFLEPRWRAPLGLAAVGATRSDRPRPRRFAVYETTRAPPRGFLASSGENTSLYRDNRYGPQTGLLNFLRAAAAEEAGVAVAIIGRDAAEEERQGDDELLHG